MDHQPYVRLPQRRVRRRRVRRLPPWLLPAILCLALTAGLAVAAPRLRSRLVPVRTAPAGSGWEYLGFRDREIVLVEAHRREPVVYCVTADGMARSDDAGKTWQAVMSPAGQPTALAVGIGDADLLLLGTQAGGVYRSEDGGQSWRPAAVSGDRVEWAAFDPQRPRIALVVTAGREGGVWRSADYGRTWSRLAAGPLLAAGFHPRDGQVYYTAGPARVSRTADGGRTWAHLDLAAVRAVVTSAADYTALYLLAADRLWYYSAWGAGPQTIALPGQAVELLVHPEDADLLYLGTAGGLYRSEDRGRTWILYSEGLGPVAVTRLALGMDGRTLYAGTGGGLWRYSPAGPGEGALP